ncbi:cobalt-precorrin-5B (C(1))-methyltransferase CbiD [Brunnivagina elsteri]|uniref:Cobalt-precorrin-5B C(1)-methyltransferase n=1 Tax=Brunnivagina elsteri CCALA 953 TaxID=987040 RepID=A0A2A2TD18_9CYAN|nr:cobalt-precorrin-5B (C(1))-methyltransferase CbiD [Calothrix elsteri]PAX51687.1 cobalt-precorrin-5B (C(1))-methyltransferase [Calothrix elsteri CCALA 953]
MAQTGYTLPVFAIAAAKAALLYLMQAKKTMSSVSLDLLPEIVDIPIQQVASLDRSSALAITISEPGDNLDLTRNTPIWAIVKLSERQEESLILEGGEGLGKTATGEAAIYEFARRLFDVNLLPIIPVDTTVTVSIILPEGRQLARRTSNEAFGVLEGLSLLGTSGISQPLSTLEKLEDFKLVLQDKVKEYPNLVFCIGSNGQQVAQRLLIPAKVIISTGNWIGAMLVEAGLYGAESVLLIGYQGKLIKLAGGIFNTSSHIADGKLEIISAAVVEVGGDIEMVKTILNQDTADAAYKYLVELGLSDSVFTLLADKISQKAENYVKKYADVSMKVGTILFDRKGQIISQNSTAKELKSLRLE